MCNQRTHDVSICSHSPHSQATTNPITTNACRTLQEMPTNNLRKEEGGRVNALAKRVHKHDSHVRSVFGAAWNTVRYNGTVLSTTLKKNVGAQRGSTYVTIRFMLENGVENLHIKWSKGLGSSSWVPTLPSRNFGIRLKFMK